ncbi:FHA domain-containing protein [Candidatus Uabimicrobium amorphum]|uniref:FHA domain-containing protein n=1 Tax=Uabimicrobium amorphum TaxID=2596890 RepID=A0A5S9F4X8_UABAM|nr:FHA domain-containing protein [Candidatus Uabimicrobium amorphum]BBM86255.1 hypothetical protein UABAM_04641 [Candidatus Uabimicrobium amorphum]
MNAYFEDLNKEEYWVRDSQKKFVIGRKIDSDIILDDPVISNEHITVVIYPDEPENSKYELLVNGHNKITYINKVLVPQFHNAFLKRGDTIIIKYKGVIKYKLVFKIDDIDKTINPDKENSRINRVDILNKFSNYEAIPTENADVNDAENIINESDLAANLLDDNFFRTKIDPLNSEKATPEVGITDAIAEQTLLNNLSNNNFMDQTIAEDNKSILDQTIADRNTSVMDETIADNSKNMIDHTVIDDNKNIIDVSENSRTLLENIHDTQINPSAPTKINHQDRTEIDYNKTDEAYIISMSNLQVFGASNFNEKFEVVQQKNNFYVNGKDISLNNDTAKKGTPLLNNDMLVVGDEQFLFVQPTSANSYTRLGNMPDFYYCLGNCHIRFYRQKNEFLFWNLDNGFSFFVFKVIPFCNIGYVQEKLMSHYDPTQNFSEVLKSLEETVSEINRDVEKQVLVIATYIHISNNQLCMKHFGSFEPISLSTANYPIVKKYPTCKFPPIGYGTPQDLQLDMARTDIKQKTTTVCLPFNLVLWS